MKDGLRIRATLENAHLLSDEEVQLALIAAAPTQFDIRMKRDAYGRLVVMAVSDAERPPDRHVEGPLRQAAAAPILAAVPTREQIAEIIAAAHFDVVHGTDFDVADALLREFDIQLRSPHPIPEPGDEEETRYIESLSNYDEIVKRAHPIPDANEEP